MLAFFNSVNRGVNQVLQVCNSATNGLICFTQNLPTMIWAIAGGCILILFIILRNRAHDNQKESERLLAWAESKGDRIRFWNLRDDDIMSIESKAMVLTDEGIWVNDGGEETFAERELISHAEIMLDGKTVTKSNGVGRAVAGGLLFGGVGAVVGAVTSKSKDIHTVKDITLKITLNDPRNPALRVKFLMRQGREEDDHVKKAAESAELWCDTINAL